VNELGIRSLCELLSASGVDPLVAVPTSGLNELYRRFGDRCLFATREEEAVALATGLALGGRRPLVIMQQSGVGNCLNALFSLADAYDVYFPIVVCDRGEADPNPVQQVSSRETARVLGALGAARLDLEAGGCEEVFGNCFRSRVRWMTCAL
jgi:sulfopyruvate decarboxylase TPP-binding subunit